MKKGIIGLLVIACALGACQKDVSDPNYNPELGASVPDGFKWSTTKTLTVNVNVNDEYNGKYYYAVRVYDKVPAEGILPVAASSKVNGEMQFSQKIVVPATVTKLYIHQVFKKSDASEVIVKKELTIDGENISCSFGNGGGTRSVSTRKQESGTIVKSGEIHTITNIEDTPSEITVESGGALVFNTGGELFKCTITIKDGGKMTADKDTKLSLKNSAIYNYGNIHIYDIDFNNGSTLYNGDAMEGQNEGGCFYAHHIYMTSGHGGEKRYLGERSYTSCETLTLDNVKLTFKTGAWLNCTLLDADKTNGQGANTFNGDGNSIINTNFTGLATIGTIKSNLTIESNVLVQCKNATGTIKGEIVPDASGMITITGTTCNEGGFGNNEKAELGTYTYIIEDMFPTQGDYDMNDIVVTLTVEQDDDELDIEGSLKAVGATYAMIPYIRVNDKSYPLFEKNGQALEAHAVLSKGEVKASPINTLNDQKFYPYEEFDLELEDTKVTNIDDIDFYIVVNGQEIHWNKIDNSKKACWGMRIPGEDFKWPQEKVDIVKAYPEFKKWFENSAFAWYNNSKSDLIYNKK